MKMLDEYLVVGGMPNIVNTYINNIGMDDVYKLIENLLEDLQSQQRVDIIRDLSKPDRNKVLGVYNSIESTMIKLSGIKIQKYKVSNIDTKTPNKKKYINSIDILTRSKILLPIMQSNSDNPKIDKTNNNMKLVYSDMGFLSNSLGINNTLEIVNDNKIKKGLIAENFVAIELQYLKQPIKYWYKSKDNETKSNKIYEVDFLHYNSTNNISVPIEVKSGIHTKKYSSLKKYKKIYNPNYSIILSRKNFFIDEKNSIIKLPLYAIHLIDSLIDSIVK